MGYLSRTNQDGKSNQDLKIMFVMLNHKLTEEQKHYAIEKYGIEKFVELPKELAKKFAAVPTADEIGHDCIGDYDLQFKIWMTETIGCSNTYGQFLLIAGEPTLCYSLIRWFDGTALTATSKRVSVETMQEDGSVKKTNIFKFAGYRRY